ncbi:MAG: ArgE/DapE family deacylase [Opitutales bacterium]
MSTEENLDGLLAELVAIPSVNPAYGGEGEAEVAAFVAGWLSQRGMDVELQEVFPGRNNVIARCGKVDGGPAILLEAHMDTVGVEGWAKGSPFDPARKGVRLYGRGSCDTKASLATFMSIAAHFARNPSLLSVPLVFAATVDEESGQTGASALMELDLNLQGAIVGEPTLLEIVHAHKGVLRFAVRTAGVSAHSALPEKGENAILRMGKVLERFAAYAGQLRNMEAMSALGRPTVNVGMIRGGKGVNIVPDFCVIEVDRRTLPEETAEEIVEGIRCELKDCPSAEIVDASLSFRRGLHTPKEHILSRAFANALERSGEKIVFSGAPYMTNATAYATAGVPALVFGPGDIARAHKIDEWVDTRQLPRAFEVLRRFFSQ